MVDSHCHLADEAFANDLEAVVERARAAGLQHALCILSAGDTSEQTRASRVAATWPEVRFAVGVHPHQAGRFVDRVDEVTAVVSRQLEANDKARAVGEIGLDYHYDFAPRTVQQAVFRHQVRLARDLRVPVVIHTREATADTLQILQEEGEGDLSGVFHCFTGTSDEAREALRLGFHVSFAGIVSFPKAGALREAARIVPADRLLIETDSPYLAPVPYRGKRNEPAWVVHVAEALAAARGDALDEVVRATTDAFTALVRP